MNELCIVSVRYNLTGVRQVAWDVVGKQEEHQGPDDAALDNPKCHIQAGGLTTSHSLPAMGEIVTKPVRGYSVAFQLAQEG